MEINVIINGQNTAVAVTSEQVKELRGQIEFEFIEELIRTCAANICCTDIDMTDFPALDDDEIEDVVRFTQISLAGDRDDLIHKLIGTEFRELVKQKCLEVIRNRTRFYKLRVDMTYTGDVWVKATSQEEAEKFLEDSLNDDILSAVDERSLEEYTQVTDTLDCVDEDTMSPCADYLDACE